MLIVLSEDWVCSTESIFSFNFQIEIHFQAKEMTAIDVGKFKQMVDAIGADTIQAIATAGPDQQVHIVHVRWWNACEIETGVCVNPLWVWTVPSLFQWKFWNIRDGVDPDGQLRSIASGAIESNCPSGSKPSRIFQNFLKTSYGTAHTVGGFKYMSNPFLTIAVISMVTSTPSLPNAVESH